MKLKMVVMVAVLGGLAVLLVVGVGGREQEVDAAGRVADAAGQVAAAAVTNTGSRAGDDPAPATKLHIYKTETCGCCALWVEHVEAAGFEVVVENLSNADLAALKQRHGVPFELSTCHTALAGDYVFEGHIPAEVIKSFLEAEPELVGIAVPGMPIGSPGMEDERRAPQAYDVIAFDGKGNWTVYKHIAPR